MYSVLFSLSLLLIINIPVYSSTAADSELIPRVAVLYPDTKLLVGPRGSAVERQSLACVFSPSCARLVADGLPLMWVSRPL